MAGPSLTASMLDATVSIRATAAFPLLATVRVTPVERVVGMQQNTASPSAISGGDSGSRSTPKAASGVTARMASMPYSSALVARRAAAVSPRCSNRPEMTKMPIVAATWPLAAAAATPAAGKHQPSVMASTRPTGMKLVLRNFPSAGQGLRLPSPASAAAAAANEHAAAGASCCRRVADVGLLGVGRDLAAPVSPLLCM